MVLEIADFEVKPGMEQELESGVRSALPIFKAARGFIDLQLHKCIENPLRYRVFLRWETIEDHTEGFRKSEGFQQWRQLVGHCFADAPKVDHSHCVLTS